MLLWRTEGSAGLQDGSEKALCTAGEVRLLASPGSQHEYVCPFVLQFLTFSERLSNVNIDIIHRIDRTGSSAEVRKATVVILC